MGAWGAGLLANAAAGDLMVFWEGFILPMREQDPDTWTPDRVADLFMYFRPFRPSLGKIRADEAAEVLALGALFRRHRMEIPAWLWLRLVAVANMELDPERLADWSEPAKRKRVLKTFIKAIRGDVNAPKESLGAPPSGSLQEEIAQLKKFAPQLERWIPVLRGPSPDDEFSRTYPTFIDRIVDLFRTPGDNHQLKEWEAVKYRLMILGWFLGCVLRLPDDEILALIDKAEVTGGRLPFSIVS